MNRSHAILAGPLFFALLGTAFCVWSALGNDVNFCVTTGCTLYQDFTVAGISLWWFGTAAFGALAGLALLGAAEWARIVAALAILGDICLLLLMAFTAPCISCLVAALLFAIIYFLLRREPAPQSRMRPEERRHSVLLWVWAALFVVNVGAVARSQADVWPILDESENPVTRMFFSPSCRYCIEGINALSGNVDVAFYPLAETEADVWKVARMRALLDEGLNIAQALAQSQNVQEPSGFASWRPGMLLLRFRLLRNKAHVFAAGSQGVPFFEQRGLPGDIRERVERAQQPRGHADARPGRAVTSPAAPDDDTPRDERLPLETGGLTGSGGTQCGGAVPCPPGSEAR
ncbi:MULTISPECIES: hypothetical protein [unclassified Desulfovibrio]|uniref:hypothetical protein n=1 Tax=unclassified Desulfovibrio TaxID=2593640 RepID=UPI0013EB878A|nr:MULTISPECIES: hypothetical protein [unclassified Desulfovibrio]